MYLIPIAWLYVTVMMAVAEAGSSNGTVLGALITFALYGLLPVALVVYLMGSPARRRAIRKSEAATTSGEPPLPAGNPAGATTVPGKDTRHRRGQAAGLAGDPDAGGHAAAATQGDAVAPMRKET